MVFKIFIDFLSIQKALKGSTPTRGSRRVNVTVCWFWCKGVFFFFFFKEFLKGFCKGF